MDKNKYILWFKEISHQDVSLVGGKNASLGEMYSNLTSKGVNVPNGFAITTRAYWHFIKSNNLKDKIEKILNKVNVDNAVDLQRKGQKVRQLIMKASIPDDLQKLILDNYHKLSRFYKDKFSDVAVRTSSTAEDLPSASFAGQYWTYLNVRGDKDILRSVLGCISSLFTNRAIFYRSKNHFGQLDIALSIGIQKMVRSDLGSSGIMFTLDTESGFRNVVLINSTYGLGEMIVQGEVTPDEFYVFKPTLKKGYRSIIIKNLGTKEREFVYSRKGQGIVEKRVKKSDSLKFSLNDDDVINLAKWGMIIEDHYSKIAGHWMPMDMEWAKDGRTGQLFIVQARPETVHGGRKKAFYKEYKLKLNKSAHPILKGIAVGNKVASGKVRKIFSASKLKDFHRGEILVTKMTDPDWVPIMKMASAIITDQGSKTCHAAIVSRELGIPCIVGTEKATKMFQNGQELTIDCSHGMDGMIYKGKIPFTVKTYSLKEESEVKTKIMVNIGAPEVAFKTSFLPVNGVGLAREEFIIGEKIRVHPLALYHYKELKVRAKKDKRIKNIIRKIDKITIEHKDKREYFVKELAEGIAQIGAAFWPNPVIVRFSDFKTNEYRQLVGGELFEPQEDNPMLGWRGASRYYDRRFQPAFKMEVEAIKRVRNIFGLKNINVMVPFCRTVEEGRKVIALMSKFGLKQHKDSLKVYVMCEIPSNVILINKFLDVFDGISIGSNDLTQLTMGIDRDNAGLQKIANESNPAVKDSIKKVVRASIKRKKYAGICGQAPSDIPGFAKFLVDLGIESISLNADRVIPTIISLNRETRKK